MFDVLDGRDCLAGLRCPGDRPAHKKVSGAESHGVDPKQWEGSG